MAYDDVLAHRVDLLLHEKQGISRRAMFGGICFMLNGNMLCGVSEDRLILRVGPEKYQDLLAYEYVRPMDITGRPMKGFVFVSKIGYSTDASLQNLIDLGLKFVEALPPKAEKV